MALPKGKLSWSMGCMALGMAGAGGDPQIACLSLVSQALQAFTAR